MATKSSDVSRCSNVLPYINCVFSIVGNNAARTIGGEYVPHILSLYNDWHTADTKHRHVSIRKGLLNVLKNITNLSKLSRKTKIL